MVCEVSAEVSQVSDLEVVSYVPKAIKGNAKGTRGGMIAVALKVTAQAKSLAPVNEGQLKGSIMWKDRTGEGGRTEGEALTTTVENGIVVGTAVEHGVYQEFGTRNQNPQPFLRPAVDIVTNGQSAEKAMSEAIRKAVGLEL